MKNIAETAYLAFMDGFRPELQTCPFCGARGSCRVHACYGRSLVDFIDGRPVCHEICILRVICSCRHTHAILPDFIIPYSGYGLFFILRVLAEYFTRMLCVERLCECFSITRNQLYHWLSLFKTHKQEWPGLLSSMETTDFSFLKSLVFSACYSDFAAAFVMQFQVSFLQSHKNPADYCQKVFGP